MWRSQGGDSDECRLLVAGALGVPPAVAGRADLGHAGSPAISAGFYGSQGPSRGRSPSGTGDPEKLRHLQQEGDKAGVLPNLPSYSLYCKKLHISWEEMCTIWVTLECGLTRCLRLNGTEDDGAHGQPGLPGLDARCP